MKFVVLMKYFKKYPKFSVSGRHFGLLAPALIVFLALHVFSCGNNKEGNSKSKFDPAALISLDSLKSLNTIAAEQDVAFMILPGDSTQFDQERFAAAAEQLRSFIIKMNKENKKVAGFILEPTAVGYDRVTRQMYVKSFPVIVALGQRRIGTPIAGEITEEKLRRAYNFIMSDKSLKNLKPLRKDLDKGE
jgi:hypothetical protein